MCVRLCECVCVCPFLWVIVFWYCATPHNTSSVMPQWLDRPLSGWWGAVIQSWFGFLPHMCQLSLSNGPHYFTSFNSNSIDLPDGYRILLPFLRTASLRLLLVGPVCHSYGFAARQCHLFSLSPLKQAVTVFPLDQKPRWLQSVGVRGEASSIKAGMESDDMEYTGFKISLCSKDVGMDLTSFMCSSNTCGRIWGGKPVFNRDNGEKQRFFFFFFPPSHTSCSHISYFQERSGTQALFLCDCVSSCVPATTIACCVWFFSSDHDRGATVQSVQCQSSPFVHCCSLSASAAGQADWSYSSGAWWAQDKSSKVHGLKSLVQVNLGGLFIFLVNQDIMWVQSR